MPFYTLYSLRFTWINPNNIMAKKNVAMQKRKVFLSPVGIGSVVAGGIVVEGLGGDIVAEGEGEAPGASYAL